MPSSDTTPLAATGSRALSAPEFAQEFRHHSERLWCLAAAILGDPTLAEDVLQEAAMTGLRRLEDFRRGTSFSAWMAQIVRFTALNARRTAGRQPGPLGEVEPAEAPPVAEMRDASDLDVFDASVRAALLQLGEEARTCLLLKAVLQLDYHDIAATLEIPEGTAMSHVSRSRAKLREILSPGEAGESERSGRAS